MSNVSTQTTSASIKKTESTQELLNRILGKVESFESKTLEQIAAANAAKSQLEQALLQKNTSMLDAAKQLVANDNEINSLKAALIAKDGELKSLSEKETPEHPLVKLLGKNSADRFAERYKSARDVKDSRKVSHDLSDEILKRQIDDKEIEGKYTKESRMDSDTAMWTGIAVGVAVVAATTTVGVICWNKGVERGHLEMHDALNVKR